MFDHNSAAVQLIDILLILGFFAALAVAALAITCRTIHKGCIKTPKGH